MKNIIYNGCHSQLTSDLLDSIVTEFKVEKVFSLNSFHKYTPHSSLQEYQEIDFHKALYSQYESLEDIVLDLELVNKLSPYLMTTLKMMDRLTNYEVSSFDDRIQMYFQHLKFWNNVIETMKIDCFIATNFPHEVFDYIIYTLCQVKSIKVYFYAQTHVLGFSQVLTSIEENDPRLAQYEKSLAPAKLPDNLEQHVEKMTAVVQKPFYMEVIQSDYQSKFSFMWRTKKRFEKFSNLFKMELSLEYLVLRFYRRFTFGMIAEQRLLNYYNSLAVVPDLSKKYIYLPLHFQPECTTCPQGGVFVFQDLMIELLMASLPEDVYVYVKEHPVQGIQGRNIRFYEKISKHKRVVIVKKNITSSVLIKQAVAVATVTGTAAWESLFQETPVLLFGKIFFQFAPGVFNISDLNSCREAIKNVLADKKLVTIDQMRHFLKHFQEVTFRGWIDPVYEAESNIHYDENLKNLLGALKEKTMGVN